MPEKFEYNSIEEMNTAFKEKFLARQKAREEERERELRFLQDEYKNQLEYILIGLKLGEDFSEGWKLKKCQHSLLYAFCKEFEEVVRDKLPKPMADEVLILVRTSVYRDVEDLLNSTIELEEPKQIAESMKEMTTALHDIADSLAELSDRKEKDAIP